MNTEENCPCYSKKAYGDCCAPFHRGMAFPDNPELLMRSRYAAYCIGIYEYLLKTTHPNNPLYPVDLPAWMKQTRHFTENTTFENLIIHDVQIGENTSLVTFTAVLKQRGKNVSFTEQSLFEKYEGKWLYKDGIYID